MKKLFYLFLLLCGNLLSQAPTVGFTPVITGLAEPMHITNAGDGKNRLFVALKAGIIKVYSPTYADLGNFLDITGIPATGEQGLLSVAFHPNYRVNGYFYVMYTATGNASVANFTTVDRYTVSSTNENLANPSSKLNILSIPHTYTNHNGGEMHFGKDGFLYITTGDGGSSNDPEENSQNPASYLGKMLRINVDATSGGNNYSVPAGNSSGTPVFALGLRNPFRWSFDRANYDLYLGDVGQNAREELDYLPFNSLNGANFGWDCFEATNSFEPAGCAGLTFTPPVYSYPIGTERSIVGGQVYRGYKYPDLKGWYLCIDFYNNRLKKFDRNTNSWNLVNQTNFISNISDFGESEDGELFVAQFSDVDGAIYQVTGPTTKTVYTFTGSGDWMTASNWKEGVVPPNPLPNGAVIVIKPYNGGACTLSTNRQVSTGGDFFVEPGKNFTVNSVLRID
jgi:glucose/arabinose dehydrogenase